MEPWEKRLDALLDGKPISGKRTWKSFAEVEAERADDDADDDAARDRNFGEMAEEDDDERDDGENDDDVVSRAIAAHGGKITAAEALTWLRSDTVGREFARAHKGEPMNTTEKLNAFAKRAGGVIELAETIVAKGGLPSTLADEAEFTRLMTEHAQKLYPNMRPDAAFAKVYTEERVLREAHAIVKAVPNEMVITPVYVGGADAFPSTRRRDGSSAKLGEGNIDAKPALEQLNDLVAEQRKLAPFMTDAQLFARVYEANPGLAKRERDENRPTGHPSFPR
jgi:hypothetical protein